ncbi:MAG: translocation/assembly module TamB domain-containing protein [Parvibaculum sp.]|uniref:translocation/assembly module TamB domain-containing protein n=1 Tax=Parvibaculum sp. TaxID=2024848 RepID=UPI002ABA3286|nr:translocation/assembly module TamB domain-containing protein [Parvibaculum sp.]MDZ4382721.1 translocation/assembly module TamB domain-containing protein [Parvibaculum sp.]
MAQAQTYSRKRGRARRIAGAAMALAFALAGLALGLVALTAGLLNIAPLRQALLEIALDAVNSGETKIEIGDIGGTWPARLRLKGLTIADAQGTWLRLEEADLDWRPLALWQGQVHATRLDVRGLDIARLPEGGEESTADGGFSLTALPFEIVLDRFETKGISLGAPLTGEAVAFEAEGALSMTRGGSALTLQARRTDATPGRIEADISFVNGPERGRLKIDAEDGGEGRPGIAAALTGMRAFTHVTITAEGQSLAGLMTGRMTLDAGEALRLDAKTHGGIAENTNLNVAVEAAGSLVAENLGFAAAPGKAAPRRAHLEGKLAARDAGIYNIEMLRAEAGALALTGAGVVTRPAQARWALDAEGKLTGLGRVAGLEDASLLDMAGWQIKGDTDSGFMQVSIGEAMLKTEAGIARFSGEMTDGEDGFAIAGDGRAEITDLAPIGEMTGQRMTGKGMLTVAGLRYDETGGGAGIALETGAIETGDESLDALFADGVRGKAELAFGADGGFSASGVTLKAAQGFTASGRFSLGAGGALDGEARIAADEISGVAAGAASGALDATLLVSGNRATPGLALDAALTNGSLAGMDAREARLTADIRQGEGPVSFTMRGAGGTARLDTGLTLPPEGGARFERIDARLFGARLQGGIAVSDAGLLTGRLAGVRVALQPLGAFAGIAMEGRADIGIDFDAADGAQSVHVLFGARQIDLQLTDSLTLDRVEAEATVSDAFGKGAVDAHVSAEGGGSGNTRFTELKASAKGPLDRIAISALLRGERLTVTAEPVALDAEALYEPSRATLSRFEAQVGEARAVLASPAAIELREGLTRMQGLALDFAGPKGPGRLDASLTLRPRAAAIDATLEKLPVELVVPFLPMEATGGTISGSASLDTGGERGKAALSFEDVSLTEAGLDRLPPFGATLDAAWAKRRLTLSVRARGISKEPFMLDGSLPLVRDPQGAWPVPAARGPVEASLTWQGPMASLMALADLPGQRLTGDTDVALRAEGDISAPLVSGRATLRNGTFENFETGTAMRDLDIAVEGERSERLRFTMSARDAGQGRIEAEGTVSLAAGAENAVDMRARLDKMETVRRRDLLLAMDGTLRLTARKLPASLEAPLRLEGELTTTTARFRIPDRAGGGVPHIDVIEVQGPGEDIVEDPLETPPLPMMLDVTLKIGNPPAQVTGRGVNSLWTGSVRASGPVEDPALEGELTAEHGTLDFAGRTFTLKRGRVTFTGEKPIDPRIDIALVYSRSDFSATAGIGGRGSSPAIGLTSEPSLPRDEIISRILFEKNVGELSAFEAAQLANTAAELSGSGASGFNLLGTMQNELGLDVLRVDTGASGGTTVSAGKYLREGVYVGVEQGALASDSNVKIEVDITGNISVDSKIGNDASSDIGVNWKWDY